jgi:hypothetical protein
MARNPKYWSPRAANWQREKGSEFDVPSLVENLVAMGVLEDTSWHNDSCPSFVVVNPGLEDLGIRLWVDHPIKSRREGEGERFGVQLGEFTSEPEKDFGTGELEEALAKLFDFARDPRFENAPIRRQPWWDESAEGSELLHEFLQSLARRR